MRKEKRPSNYDYLTVLSKVKPVILGEMKKYTYLCGKLFKDMRMKHLKKQTITKLLSMLGFSSAAIVFTACYGAIPQKYQSKEYTDSVSSVLEEGSALISDTLQVTK